MEQIAEEDCIYIVSKVSMGHEDDDFQAWAQNMKLNEYRVSCLKSHWIGLGLLFYLGDVFDSIP